ncbi:MAG TPA: sigma-E factor negative regulatory protein, partial [Nitrosospira sp.]|nr:sigma-E factor negative regulatory protein [Nitrosospira sp.]
MEEKISALMDGELSEEDAASVIRKFEATDGLQEQWAVYHLISDVLEHSEARSIDVSRRVSARLAAEPARLAPEPLTPAIPAVTVLRPKAKRKPVAYAAAASIAAVFAAGWMSLQTTQAPHQQLNLADAGPAPANLASANAIPVVAVASPAAAAAPVRINDYLLAHREFSPSTAMHGVAPYTRTVAQSR